MVDDENEPAECNLTVSKKPCLAGTSMSFLLWLLDGLGPENREGKGAPRMVLEVLKVAHTSCQAFEVPFELKGHFRKSWLQKIAEILDLALQIIVIIIKMMKAMHAANDVSEASFL